MWVVFTCSRSLEDAYVCRGSLPTSEARRHSGFMKLRPRGKHVCVLSSSARTSRKARVTTPSCSEQRKATQNFFRFKKEEVLVCFCVEESCETGGGRKPSHYMPALLSATPPGLLIWGGVDSGVTLTGYTRTTPQISEG